MPRQRRYLKEQFVPPCPVDIRILRNGRVVGARVHFADIIWRDLLKQEWVMRFKAFSFPVTRTGQKRFELTITLTGDSGKLVPIEWLVDMRTIVQEEKPV